jgi:polysaccharide deacetylase family protein (PEP-CTERM system associated)
MKTADVQLLQNILCVDVEDWYHPEYLRSNAKNEVERITVSFSKTLDLVEESNANATFFVVGEIAERHPEILDQIFDNQHEIAFHGYHHDPLWTLDADALRKEIEKYDSLVRSNTGEKCIGFRAPSYSMESRTSWALDVLEEQRYVYDSSIFPLRTPLYGVRGAPITPYHPSSKNITQQDERRKLIEFPALVYPILGLRVPAGGGFYLRLLPVYLIDKAIRKMNKNGFPAVLSFHPWELDDCTPRLTLAPLKSFVTYYNLKATKRKLRSLVSRFRFTSFRNWIEDYGFA